MGVALDDEGEGEVGESGEDDLPGGGAEGVDGGSLPFFGEHGTESPGEGASLKGEAPGEFAAAEGGGMDEGGPDQDGGAGDAD